MNIFLQRKSTVNKPFAKQYVIYSLIGLLIILFAAIFLLAAVPPISRDALTHHLFVPRLYLEYGGIYEIPDLMFSYYPMNLDMLYMGIMYFGSDILPKYIHMFFGFATGYLIYRYLKQRLPLQYAILGSLFFLSIPIIVKLSITVYVDLGLVFFTTASLLLLFYWVEKNYKTRYLIIAGLCCGLAVGTKYNGLIIFFLLTLFVPSLYLRSQHSEQKRTVSAIQYALLFFFCALLTASPWFIRDWIWTGNPVYPLYNNFFNPQSVASAATSSGETSIRGVFATRYALYGENIWQLLLLPVRIFFEGMDDNPRYFDGRLNPFLLLLPLFAFMKGSENNKPRRIEIVSLVFFCLLYFLFAFNSGTLRIRYLAPMIPFLVILSMYGIHNIELKVTKLSSGLFLRTMVCPVLITLMLAYNANYVYQQFSAIDPISYLSGKLTRNEYITKYRPEFKVMQYANKNLPESAKILCIFIGNRGYYLHKDHIFDNNYNTKWLLSWLRVPGISKTEIIDRLKRHGITHILLRTDLFSESMQHNISADNQRVTAELFQKHFIHLFSNVNYSLYKIKT